MAIRSIPLLCISAGALSLMVQCNSSSDTSAANANTSGGSNDNNSTGGTANSMGGSNSTASTTGDMGGSSSTGGTTSDMGGSSSTGGTGTSTTGAGGQTNVSGSGGTGVGQGTGAGGESAGNSGTTGTAGGAGGTGAPPTNPCKGQIICEDFENTGVGKEPGNPWKVEKDKGSVTIDDSRAYRGKHSAKMSIDATTSSDTYRRAFLAATGAPLIPLQNNSVYGRMMIYTDRIPDKTVHWTLANGYGHISGQPNLSATYNYGGMGGLMANYYSETKPVIKDCWQSVKDDLPTSQWVCVAWKFDGKNNEMRFWLNGNEIDALHVFGNQKTDQTCTKKGSDGKWNAPAFQAISVGWESYQHDAAGAHNAWIDDVILDSQPIACP